MFPSRSIALFCAFFLTPAVYLQAQPKPGTDVLVFKDGEKLIGELQSATTAKVTFKSDMGFVVTVEWTKVQEIHSDKKFAAIPKELTLKNQEDAGKVPQGTLEMANQTLELKPTPQAQAQSFPVSNFSNVVPEQSFQNSLHHQGFLEGWKGLATVGISFFEATSSIRNITTSLGVERADPSESWMQVRDKTSFFFNSGYSLTTSSGEPDTKTNVVRTGVEHDHYFSPRFFALAGATFEHNSAQGLELTQAYGGGLGYVVDNSERIKFNVRAGLGYMHQGFNDTALNLNVIGSRFGETLTITLPRGATFTEDAGIRPAWNHMNAWFAGGTSALNLPVYKRLSVSISAFDSFINNPPPYFRKNTFQLTIGAGYTIR